MSEPRRFPIKRATALVLGLAVGVGSALAIYRREPTRVVDDVRSDGTVLEPVFDGLDVDRTQSPVRLVSVFRDVGQPTDLAFVPGQPDQLLATSKWGSVHRIDTDTGQREFWLWLHVYDGLECGVLGLAFHPTFETSGRFYVNHCPMVDDTADLQTVVTEFVTDPATLSAPRRVGDVLAVDQPAGTHNGGQIAFGPDGMLYVGLGDGEAGGDPHGNGQNRSTPYAALLRLDVSEPGVAIVPADNPFVGDPEADERIFAYGLRNPWRFTFTDDGTLIVADVGQSSFEEVNRVVSGGNYGWSVAEGLACHPAEEGCTPPASEPPVYHYGRDDGVSITGGAEWTAPGPLADHYLFADFATGRIWAMPLADDPVRDVLALGRFDISPSTFAQAPDGSVWVADFRSERLFRIEPR